MKKAPSPSNNSIEILTQELILLNTKTQVLIQDVESCSSSLDQLEQCCRLARESLAAQQNTLDRLDLAALHSPDWQHQISVYRDQLNSCRLKLRKCSVRAHLRIEQSTSESLFEGRRHTDIDRSQRTRRRMKNEDAVAANERLTADLRSISQQLAGQVDRSKQTLDILVTSSEKVGQAGDELSGMSSVLGQSSRLLNKYTRRELTDNILFFIAFCFFFACVFYVIHQRFFK